MPGKAQGLGAGTLSLASAFFVSGVLTYAFQGLSARALGPEGYGELAILWSATFLTVQTLWIGASQTLGRYIAEREIRAEDPGEVVASVKRAQMLTLGAFVALAALFYPPASRAFFGGEWLLYAAFVLAVAAYAPEYFARGVFSGRREFSRIGTLHVAESASRLFVAAALLALGAGVAGPAAAILLAPLVGFAVVRPRLREVGVRAGRRVGFGVREAARFSGPVVLCVAFGQALMNGGPVVLAALGASRAEVGAFLAALILARTPQYVLGPAVPALLPHASRSLEDGGERALDRFLAKSLGAALAVALAMVAGVWTFGELGMRVLYGTGFQVEAGLLIALAALAACYLLADVASQALFALDLQARAALGWALGAVVAATALILAGAFGESLSLSERVSFSLAAGALAAAVFQTALYASIRFRR